MARQRRKALILTADRFEDLEVLYPKYRLEEEDWEVAVAAPEVKEIRGEHGYPVEASVAIAEADPSGYDLLIIPGGSADGAPRTVRNIKEAQAIAKIFFEENKPVASICHGPYTLVSANVLKGRRLTSVLKDGVPEEIREAGGQWEDSEVVVDGNLVTSRGPQDLPAFMRETLRLAGSQRGSRKRAA